jgi:hypothetical protein
VRTLPASNITMSGFTANGNVGADTPLADIREKGFVYSATNSTPGLSDLRVSTTIARVGDFYMNVTGLERNTRYHVRAFLTLPSGTVFGSVVQVTTAAEEVTVAVNFHSLADMRVVASQSITVPRGSTITAAQLEVPANHSLHDDEWSVLITDQSSVVAVVTADRIPEAQFIRGTGNLTFSPHREATRGEVAQILYNLSPSGTITNPMAFSDVPANHPNRRAIDYASSRALMTGDAGGAATFRPDDLITRAEICVVLSALYQLGGAATSNFNDVPSGAWYFAYVSRAFNNNMVLGDPDGSFRPASNVTRAEVTTIFVRGEQTAGRRSNPPAPLSHMQFSDVPANHWYHRYVMNASIPH